MLHLRLALLLTSLAALGGGCRHAPALRPAPAAEERFAREYIQALRDSGVAAILPRTHPRTRALRNFEVNMSVFRDALASSHATLTLGRWRVAEAAARAPAIEIVYKVCGPGAPSEVSLFIEEHEGRLVVETINLGPPNPGITPR